MLGKQGEGNRIVAKAWVDENFKQKLLTDATDACADLGISASNTTTSTVLTVVENTENVHARDFHRCDGWLPSSGLFSACNRHRWCAKRRKQCSE